MRELAEGMRKTSLTNEQVGLILRIYWTDKSIRTLNGNLHASHRIRHRLAAQFGVSVEVIKKVIAAPGRGRRLRRFKRIPRRLIKRAAKTRVQQLYGVEKC